MSTGSGKLYLLLSKAEVSIREAFLPPRPGKAFPSTWVKLTGLPRDMIEKDRLMAGMVMIGRPLEVDELSRRKWTTEPVRMRFQCRFPERIKGTVQLTVNGEPYTVGVQAELGRSGPGGAGDGGPPKPPAPPRDDDGDDESEEHSHEAWNRHGWKKNGDKDQCQGGEVDSQKGGGADSASLAAVLGSFSAPQLGREVAGHFNQYGSNMRVFPALVAGRLPKQWPRWWTWRVSQRRGAAPSMCLGTPTCSQGRRRHRC
jgi:hypothetical protein